MPSDFTVLPRSKGTPCPRTVLMLKDLLALAENGQVSDLVAAAVINTENGEVVATRWINAHRADSADLMKLISLTGYLDHTVKQEYFLSGEITAPEVTP